MGNYGKAKVKLTPLTLLVIYRGSVITWAEYVEIRDSF